MSDLEGRLKAESERYISLLERLGERLSRSLPADVNTKGTPSRDWARSFANYDKGMRGMLAEQRERVKLKLAAGKAGQAPLSDEEYEAGMRELALEALSQLPEQELRAALAARGVDATELARSGDTESD